MTIDAIVKNFVKQKTIEAQAIFVKAKKVVIPKKTMIIKVTVTQTIAAMQKKI